MHRLLLIGPRGLTLDVEVPTSHRERMRGLAGRDDLPPGRALLLDRTCSVHTLGMRFDITVALLDRDMRVLAIRRLPRRRLLLPRRRVRHVLECRSDVDIRVGDKLLAAERVRARPAGGRVRAAPH
jgi:uncharacterized membrane protein (UPF0127 family)